MPYPRRIAGFSLTELMISVFILSVLVAIGMPSFRQFILNSQIRTAAESFQAGMNLARTEALRRNARVTFWIVSGISSNCTRSASGSSWVVSIDNPGSSCNSTASDSTSPRLIQSQSGTEGNPSVALSALDSSSVAASCITFNGFGRSEANCTGGDQPISRIVFSATSAQSLEIRVGSGGGIRMCNPSASSGAPSAC